MSRRKLTLEEDAWAWHRFFGFCKPPKQRYPKAELRKQAQAECDRINAERDAIRARGGHPDE